MEALEGVRILACTAELEAQLRGKYPDRYRTPVTPGDTPGDAPGGTPGSMPGSTPGDTPAAAGLLERLPLSPRPSQPQSASQRNANAADELETLQGLCRDLWTYLRPRTHKKTGHGPFGGTPLKLKLAFDPHGDGACHSLMPLAQLVQQFYEGRFDRDELRWFFTTQRGIALDKGNGKARPIGILEPITRVATGTLVSRWKRELLATMSPHDLGSAPGGVEGVAHTVGLFLRAHPDAVAIKLDVSNAFNTLDRRCLFETLKQHDALAPIFGAVNTLYHAPSTVTYSPGGGRAGGPTDSAAVAEATSITITNAEGVIQGEPLAGLLFDACMSHILRDVRAQAADDDVTILTIHDDTYVLGDPEPAFAARDRIHDALGARHLAENPDKATVFARAPTAATRAMALARGMPLTTDGIMVAGTPVGTQAFAQAYVSQRVDAIVDKLDRLVSGTLDTSMPAGMPRVQAVVRCVRLCVPSMLTHLLRTGDPTLTAPHAARLDEAVAKAAASLLGYGASAELLDGTTAEGRNYRRRLFLPYEMGGLGITSSSMTVDAAYCASWALAGQLVQRTVNIIDRTGRTDVVDEEHLTPLADALGRLRAIGVKAAPLTVTDCVGARDARLQHTLYEQAQAGVLTQLRKDLAGNVVELAKLLSAGSGDAFAWLAATPALKKTQLDDGDFRAAAAYRLGLRLGCVLPQLPARMAPCLRCGAAQDDRGDHAFRCQATRRFASRRHNEFKRDFFHQAFSRQCSPHVAGVCTARMEDSMDHLFGRREGVNSERRADISITHAPPSSGLDKRAIDFVGAHPTPDATGHQRDASVAGAAAARAEDAKYRAYTKDYNMRRENLIPFAIETSGAVGPAGRKLIKDLANLEHPVAWVEMDGALKPLDYDGLRGFYIRCLRERLAVSWQRSCADILRSWVLACCRGVDPDAYDGRTGHPRRQPALHGRGHVAGTVRAP